MAKPTTYELQTALHTWLSTDELGVSATLTFLPRLEGRRMTWPDAQEAVRVYLRRLDGAAYGRSGLRKGKEVGAVAVREGIGDGIGKHLHYHLRLKVPTGFTLDSWSTTAQAQWPRLRWASSEHNVFRPMWSSQWLAYILKDRDKPSYSDAMDYENWRLV